MGKLGIVRLKGKDLLCLRFDCFHRDRWRCVECNTPIYWGPIAATTPEELIDLIYKHDNPPIYHIGQMAHIRTKRNNGDTLDNVRTLCPDCHRKEHAYGKSMQKPCPKKEGY